jgi:nicotinic acid phosphoribosyltransferase
MKKIHLHKSYIKYLMKKIHLHKSYIKYLRRYMFQLKEKISQNDEKQSKSNQKVIMITGSK